MPILIWGNDLGKILSPKAARAFADFTFFDTICWGNSFQYKPLGPRCCFWYNNYYHFSLLINVPYFFLVSLLLLVGIVGFCVIVFHIQSDMHLMCSFIALTNVQSTWE